ncbi:hypothetical protein Trydic_g19451 [Trypoxylus dichotomus]
MNAVLFFRENIEAAIQKLEDLDKDCTEIMKQLRQILTENTNDLQKSIAKYRESKENLLKTGNIQLSDEKIQYFFREYEATQELKEKKRLEISNKLFEVKDLLQSKADVFIKHVGEFVEKQNEALSSLDLKSLQEMAKRENRLRAFISAKIEDDTSFFRIMQDAVKDQEVTVSFSITSVDVGNDNDVSDDIDVIDAEKAEADPKEESSLVLYNIEEVKNNNDLSLVRCFLTHLKFGECNIVSIERIGRRTKGSIRPIKVTFADKEIVEKLLQLPNGKTKFNECYVRVGKC